MFALHGDLKSHPKSYRETDTTQNFSDDIKMESGLDKCATLAIKNEKEKLNTQVKLNYGMALKPKY